MASARIGRGLAVLRERLLARIRSVNEVTACETIAAGRALGTVVSVARDQIATLKRAVAASTQGGLQVAVNELATHVRAQTIAIRDALLDHHHRLDKATARAMTIIDAAKTVDSLTREARVLAINAVIEAQRVRSQATGMPVIADEMQRLAKAIARTNATIQELAYDLGEALPAVSSHGAKVVAACREFETSAATRISDIERCARELEGGVQSVMAAADTSLAQVVSESHSALSHLQFQDVCAQRLLELDLWAHDTHVEAVREEGSVDPVAPPAQIRLGDQGSQDVASQATGDVLLF